MGVGCRLEVGGIKGEISLPAVSECASLVCTGEFIPEPMLESCSAAAELAGPVDEDGDCGR